MKKLVWLSLFLMGICAVSFSYKDDTYESAEVMDFSDNTMYVRFRVNIELVKDYIEDRIDEVEKEIKKASKSEKKNLERMLDNYEFYLERMNSGKELLGVWVFGDFNGWKTAVSDIPNTLVAGKSNPDTYYAKTYVPITYDGDGEYYRYKFVLNYGTYIDEDGAEKDDFVYIEDPLADVNTDDGFGGYNSEFTYAD